VSFSLHRLHSNAEGGTIYSGPDGKFSIENQVGLDLEIYRLQKAGYTQLSSSSGTSNPPTTTNNAANPTLYKMWKQSGPEELIIIGGEYDAKPNAKPILVDLLAGKIVDSGGDVRIYYIRSSTQTNPLKPFDWSYRIEPVDGGIQTTDEIGFYDTYLAPTLGYQTSFERSFSADDPRSVAQDSRFFFVKSRDEKVFSKFGLSINAGLDPDKPARMQFFRGVANPNGSRNWEQDQRKMHSPD
jgi:hypothetical protein